MSWENSIENIKFTIITGDGKSYFPLWKSGEKSKEFNTTEFDFINVKGTLVERKKARSSKYPFVFWFQGENNIEQSEEFERSAEDSRLWTVTHPFYGTIKGQPTSISRNDENFNITEITVDFWESIDADYPVSNFNVKDNTYEKKEVVLQSAALSYGSNSQAKTADIAKNKDSINQVSSSFKGVQTDETNPDYLNAISKALSANENLLKNPLAAILATQKILDLPSTYEISVFARLKSFLNSYEKLKKKEPTYSDKLYFEVMGSTLLASYCNAAINPLQKDYERLPDVENVSSNLLAYYQDYLTLIDNYSVSVYNIENTYQPDPLVQGDLYSLVMFTVGNLFDAAFESRQERVIYLKENSNLILLTHKYLGLDADDDNINAFRVTNNITLQELFTIKKDRKIIYYI